MRGRKPFIRAGALFVALGIVLVIVLWMALVGPVSAVEAQTSQTPLANPTFWTSGWVTLAPGTSQVFNHNLGLQPEKYAVELWFQDADNGWGINRRNYGGLEAGGKFYGAHWSNLTANTVQVFRQADDNAADQIRIQVWVPPLVPDFDSGWIAIPAGQQHSLRTAWAPAWARPPKS